VYIEKFQKLQDIRSVPNNRSLSRLYSVVAPSFVAPGQPLLVTVHLLRPVEDRRQGGGSAPVMVTASLLQGENSVASVTKDLAAGTGVPLVLEVPGRLQGRDYRLEVEGVLLTALSGSLFHHSVPLAVFRPSQLLAVRLDRAVFLTNETVRFLVSVAQTDLRPYSGPVAVELVGPGGTAMQQWSYRTGQGVRALTYRLAGRTPLGRWSVRARAGDGSAEANFHVLAWRPGAVDVAVEAAAEVEVEPGVGGVLEATVTASDSRTGLPVRGTLRRTATLLATDSREQIGRLNISQPEWGEINARRTFGYTAGQVEAAR
jgi:hypothetical protein